MSFVKFIAISMCLVSSVYARRGGGGGGGSSADLSVSIINPQVIEVDQLKSYSIEVKNKGSKRADNVSLTIQLPVTNSSPTVYLMGEIQNLDSQCSISIGTITCSLGNIRGGNQESIDFDLALPHATKALSIIANVSSDSNDSNSANDESTFTAQLSYPSINIQGPVTVTNTHCTGTNLTSFFTCEVSPSSTSSHDAIYKADGTVDFPFPSPYHGNWSQSSSEDLSVEYKDTNEVVVMSFVGKAVDAKCFEGITTFSNSSYNAAYRICLP
ncbi:MAG: hypothetical protein H6621_06500 [Halobacteriovoraceae bacterium]|nr:hypothetical protein [Halobacteriovoraceae bacterium]